MENYTKFIGLLNSCESPQSLPRNRWLNQITTAELKKKKFPKNHGYANFENHLKNYSKLQNSCEGLEPLA
jgi:hypothetical protein